MAPISLILNDHEGHLSYSKPFYVRWKI